MVELFHHLSSLSLFAVRNVFTHHRRVLELSAFVLGILCAVIACGVLIAHADAFRAKRESALKIGMQLPELESSVALLQANVEAETLFFEDGLASREELADVYILPLSSPTPRLVTSLTAIADALSIVGSPLSIEKVTVSAPPEVTDGLKKYHAHLVLRGTFQSVSRFLGILSFSGDMMVKDVLPLDTQQSLLQAIEAIAPLTLRHGVDFLYTDLLEYASDPEVSEQRMLSDIPTDTAMELRSMVLRAGLAHVRSSLQDIAKTLREKHVWPFPLVDVTALRREGDRWMIDMTVYGR